MSGIVRVTDKRLGVNMPRPMNSLAVDGGFPLARLADIVLRQPHAVTLIFASHGLPGYVQCCNGAVPHPTAGPGITINDLPIFEKMRKKLNAIEFQCCLVARMGTCFECGGHIGYDGNEFCFKLAMTARATVKASLHLQYGGSNEYCTWSGTVFTWGPSGNIINRTDYPLDGSVTCVNI